MKTQSLSMTVSRVDRIFKAKEIARTRLYAMHRRSVMLGIGQCLSIAQETGGNVLAMLSAKYGNDQIALGYIESIILA